MVRSGVNDELGLGNVRLPTKELFSTQTPDIVLHHSPLRVIVDSLKLF